MKTLQITHEQIAARAYQIHLANGCPPGHEQDDWLQAQYELLHRPVRVLGRFGKHHLSAKIVVAVNGVMCLSQ